MVMSKPNLRRMLTKSFAGLCMADVTTTLEDARSKLLAEIDRRQKEGGPGCVVCLVGHALHHDLNSLRLVRSPPIIRHVCLKRNERLRIRGCLL